MSVVEEYSNVNFYEDDYESYYHDDTLVDVWNNCVVLSVYSIFPTIANVVVLNFLFGLVLGTRLFPKICFHLVSVIIGVYLINTLESAEGKLILVGCFVGSFLILHVCQFMKKLVNMQFTANFVKIMLITLLVLCEYYFVQRETWLQIRGIVMVLVMKVISLADDVETINYMPNFAEYFGYTLCGANVLFGPWIPFSEYKCLSEKPPKRNIYWICSVAKLLATSLFCLTLSNCWGTYLVGNEANRWIKAYQEAFSFRTSHYFVCYLSEVAMVSFGFNNAAKKSNKWSYTITEPMEIEFPSSLSVVVRKWNQPMHDFLKKYIYRSWLDHGRFVAVFVTFLVSSFLHGLELKVSVVLVTIGVFSYLQVAPRNKVSEMFDSCLKIRPCKDCKHKYKRTDFKVKLMLFMYSLATIMHLAYLGVLMDPSTEDIGIFEKWQNLYFLSHIVMFFNLLLIL